MPGPLSMTVTRKRVAWLAGGGAAPLVATTSSVTTTSGRIPASSQASSALSTASLTQVRSALRGLSKPSKWRFLVKNSETEISRWRAPISAADTAGFGVAVRVSTGAALDFGMASDISSFTSPLESDLERIGVGERGNCGRLRNQSDSAPKLQHRLG